MKRGLILSSVLSLILLVEIVNAQSALIDTLTAGITPQLITLSVLFVVFFAVLNFSTSKIFKGNKPVSVVVSLAISLLIVYWINQSISVGDLFSGFGISDSLLYTIGPILLVGLIIFLFIKIKSLTFLVLGGVALIAALTGLVYEATTLAVIGVILIIVGILFAVKKKRTPSGSVGNSGSSGNVYNTTYNTHHHHYPNPAEVRKEQAEARAREAARENDIHRMEGKAQADAQAARAREKMDEAQAMKAKQGEQEVRQQENRLISTDIKSLMHSYQALDQTYTEIYSKDPGDLRLPNMREDMRTIRDEMIRIKRGQR